MNNIRVIIKEDGLIRDRIIPNKVGNVVGKVLTKLYQKCFLANEMFMIGQGNNYFKLQVTSIMK